MKTHQFWNGDCLKLMSQIDSATVDVILCDLPFGVTNSSWDIPIQMESLWEQYRRIIKPHGVIILNSQGIFTAKLIMAAPDLYRYSLVWQKNKVRGFLNAKRQPLRIHEDILVFYQKQPTYHPQKTSGHSPVHKFVKKTSDGSNYGKTKLGISGGGSTERYPTSIIKIPVVNNDIGIRTHSCQKPVELGEYLIKTYSNPGDLILDNAAGTGAYLVAAQNLQRNFIGIELNRDYYQVGCSRLKLQ